jgi:glutathione peroxidase
MTSGMRALFSALLLAACSPAAAPSPPVASAPAPAAAPANIPEGPVIDHTIDKLEGGQLDLAAYRGKVLLLVNTASQCGMTPQYAGLEELHDTYKDRGLVIIGLPSNDHGGQEPGSAEEIATFCKKNYGVSFQMAAKVHTKGPEIAPLYKALTQDTPEGIRGEVKWNFTKFLIDKQGRVVARFEPKTPPAEIAPAIEKLL